MYGRARLWKALKEFLLDRGDVMSSGGPSNDAGCRTLDELQFLEGFVREIKKEGVAVVSPGVDKMVDGQEWLVLGLRER